MFFFYFFTFMLCFYQFFQSFNKKIILLLIFECFYMVSLFFFMILPNSIGFSIIFFTSFLVIMVLGSIFGVTLLISFSRETSFFSWKFLSF